MEIDLSDLFSDVNQVNEYLKANTNIGDDLDLNDVFDRLEDAALSGWQTRDRIREDVQQQIIRELGLTKKEEKVSEASAVPKPDLLDNAVEPSIDLLENSVKQSTDFLDNVVKPSADFLDKAMEPSIDLLDNVVKPTLAKESTAKNKRKRAELILSRNPHVEDKKLKICKFASVSLFDDVQNTMVDNEDLTGAVKNDERVASSLYQMAGNVKDSQLQQKPNVAEVICNDALKPTTSKDMKDNGAIKDNVNPGDKMDEGFVVVSDNSDDEDDLAVVGMVVPMYKGSSAIPHPGSSSSSSSSTASVGPIYPDTLSEARLKLKKIKAHKNAAKLFEESVMLKQIKDNFANARKRFRCIRKQNPNKFEDKKKKKFDKKNGNSFKGESSSESKISKKPSFNKINKNKNKVKLVSPGPSSSTGGPSFPLNAHCNLDIASSPGPSKACSKGSSKASSPGPSKLPTISNVRTRSKSAARSSSNSVGNSDTIRSFIENDISDPEDIAKQLEEMFPHFSPEYLLKKAKQFVTIENTIDVLLNDAAVEDYPKMIADEMKLVKERVAKYEMKLVKERVAKSLLLLGEEDMFMKVTLTEKRDFNPDDPLENKFRLAKGHYLNVSGHFASAIESIDYVENRELIENFERKKSEFRTEGKDAKEYFLFHGTNNVNVDNILKENFRMDLAGKNGQVHGRGIYFSEKTIIPNQYMNGTKKTLLLCRVLLGREFLGSEKDIPKGFDSKSVLPDEEKRANINIIKDVDQILPCFVLNLAPSSGQGHLSTQLMKSGRVKTIIIKKSDTKTNLTKK